MRFLVEWEELNFDAQIQIHLNFKITDCKFTNLISTYVWKKAAQNRIQRSIEPYPYSIYPLRRRITTLKTIYH